LFNQEDNGRAEQQRKALNHEDGGAAVRQPRALNHEENEEHEEKQIDRMAANSLQVCLKVPPNEATELPEVRLVQVRRLEPTSVRQDFSETCTCFGACMMVGNASLLPTLHDSTIGRLFACFYTVVSS